MKNLFILCLLFPLMSVAQKKKTEPKTFDLLIGTYTTGKSEGIYVYRFYTETGRTAYLNVATGVDNPSYLAVSDDRKHVYAVNEIGDDRTGSVTAFTFEPKYGKMELINKQPSIGAGPCYISVDKNKKHVFVANYAGGSMSVLPINKDGSLGAVVQTLQDQGSSVNKQRQEKPHVHTAVLSPDEKYLLYTDLGTDKVNIYRYHSGNDKPLDLSSAASISVTPGDGPRHIDFTPDKKIMYLITEMGGNIHAYNYDGGKLKQFQVISLVPDGYTGKIGAADIHLSPDGKFLYATNRGDANEVIVYAINQENGTLTFVQRTSTLGKTPRNFVIDPTGKFLLVANQNSDSVIVFKIDQTTGKLTQTPHKIEVGNPSCLKFVSTE